MSVIAIRDVKRRLLLDTLRDQRRREFQSYLNFDVEHQALIDAIERQLTRSEFLELASHLDTIWDETPNDTLNYWLSLSTKADEILARRTWGEQHNV
jgi:hypothetical protein